MSSLIFYLLLIALSIHNSHAFHFNFDQGRQQRRKKKNKNSGRDFYKILGVGKQAGERELKKAFRKLSLKYHPDKCDGDECSKQFTDVNAAYEALSDGGKRRAYDQGGEDGLKEFEAQSSQAGAGMNPFAQFFGMGGQQEDAGEQKKGPNTVVLIDISLKSLYMGAVVEVGFERDILCHRWDECETNDNGCHAAGIRVKKVQLAPGFVQQVQEEDSKCVARGKRYKKKCRACPDGATIPEVVPITLDIEPGMAGGTNITYDEMADEGVGTAAGNLIFTIMEESHPFFTRSGDDLNMRLGITLVDSLLGFTTTIEHVDGHTVDIESEDIINCEHVMTLEGEGMPTMDGGYGNLIITFDIEFPAKKFTKKQKTGLRKVLA